MTATAVTYFLDVIAVAIILGFVGLFVYCVIREVRWYTANHRQARELRARAAVRRAEKACQR